MTDKVYNWRKEEIYKIFREQDELHIERLKKQLEEAKTIILTLRNKLQEADSTLPGIYDGNAWAVYEQQWYRELY